MKRGFTLVEMTVVLIILAALTHLAVRQLSQVRDARLETVANRQLEEIRAAVYARAAGESTGFLADMGRLPRITNATNATLEELWICPAGARDFALRPAVSNNFSAATADISALEDADVYVPTGWRGPYLHIPFGRDELLDPWGNPMVEKDAAGLARLTVTNEIITAVSHYGATGQRRGKRTLPLAPPQGATSRLFVTFVATETALPVTCMWYGAADGWITGGVTNDVPLSETIIFADLAPGLKVVKVAKGDKSIAVRSVDLRPGDNLLQITLP